MRLICLAVLDLAWLLGCSLAGAWGYRLFGPGHAVLTAATLFQVRTLADWRQPGGTMLWIAATAGPVGLLIGRALQPLFGRVPLRLHLPAPDGDIGGEAVEPVAATLTRLPDAALIGPMAPVFRHGRIGDRQAAIEAAVLSYQPRLSAIVAMGLTDRDQTIRALAASASTRAGQLLIDRRQRLERAIMAHGRLDDRIALATMLADHGEHDRLLSPARRARLRAEAAGLLRDILTRLRPGDPRHDPRRDVRYDPGHDPRHEAMLALLQRMEPDGGDPDTLPLGAAIDRLYRQRDLAGLARRCRAPDAMALREDDPLHAMAAWWRGAIPA